MSADNASMQFYELETASITQIYLYLDNAEHLELDRQETLVYARRSGNLLYSRYFNAFSAAK